MSQKNFYKHLKHHNRYSCIESDIRIDTSDILPILQENKVDLCIADGAPSESEYKDENLQEFASFTIVTSELEIVLNILGDQGNFIIKCFDIFTEYSRSFIYLLSRLFSKVYLTKPEYSRVVNSEKYVVCLEFNKNHPELEKVKSQLKNFKMNGLKNPTGIVNIPTDKKFDISIDSFIRKNVQEQTTALRSVVDRCYELLMNQNDVIENQTRNDNKGKNQSFTPKGKNGKKGKGKGKQAPKGFGKGKAKEAKTQNKAISKGSHEEKNKLERFSEKDTNNLTDDDAEFPESENGNESLPSLNLENEQQDDAVFPDSD